MFIWVLESTKIRTSNIGALIIRMGFGAYCTVFCTEEPQRSIGNYPCPRTHSLESFAAPNSVQARLVSSGRNGRANSMPKCLGESLVWATCIYVVQQAAWSRTLTSYGLSIPLIAALIRCCSATPTRGCPSSRRLSRIPRSWRTLTI